MKLRIKLITAAVLISSISLITISLFSYFGAKKQVATTAEQQLYWLTHTYASELSTWLAVKTSSLEATGDIISGAIDSKTVQANFLKTASIDPDIRSIYLSLADGSYLDSSQWVPPPGWTAQEHDWYQKAMDANGPIFTQPYQDQTTGDYLVTVAVPLKDSAQMTRGILAENLSLTRFLTKVAGIAEEVNGYAILLDSTGTILYHPSTELIGRKAAETLVAPAESAILSNQTYGVVLAQDDSYLFFRKLPATNWTLAILVPDSIYSLSTIRNHLLIAALLVLVSTAYAAHLVSRKLTDPLLDLTETAEQIAAGNALARSNLTGRDELSQLAFAINAVGGTMATLNRQVITAISCMQITANNLQHTSQTASQTISEVVSLTQQSADQTQPITQGLLKLEEIDEFGREITQITADASQIVENMQTAVDNTLSVMNNHVQLSTKNRQAAANTINNVDALQGRSREISLLGATIAKIGAQIKLLALNTAIESTTCVDNCEHDIVITVNEINKLAEQICQSGKQLAEWSDTTQTTITALMRELNVSGSVIVGQEKSALDSKKRLEYIQLSTEIFAKTFSRIMARTEQLLTNAYQATQVLQTISQSAKQNIATAEEIVTTTQDQSSFIRQINDHASELLDKCRQLEQAGSQHQLPYAKPEQEDF